MLQDDKARLHRRRGIYRETTSLSVRAEIGKYACHHSVAAPVAAPRFRDKHGSHECTSLFHTPPRFLHVLNFRGRPIITGTFHPATSISLCTFCIYMYQRMCTYIFICTCVCVHANLSVRMQKTEHPDLSTQAKDAFLSKDFHHCVHMHADKHCQNPPFLCMHC